MQVFTSSIIKNKAIWIAIYIVVVTLLLLVMIERLKQDAYASTANQINENLENLIEAKADALRLLAISLAEKSIIRKALLSGDHTHLRLDQLSLKLKKDSVMKNLWFQIIDKEGNSFYRSWTKKRGDSLLLARPDIAMQISKPMNFSLISTGKFDLSFKSIVPIYEGEQFLGFFEVIAKFNSVAKKMDKRGYKPVYLVDPSYKNQITNPFSGKFVNDYYVANTDAGPHLIEYLTANPEVIDKFLYNTSRDYLVLDDTGQMIVYYTIPDVNGAPMAHFFSFVPFDKVDTNSVAQLSLMLVLAAVLLITIAMETARIERLN